MLYSLKIHEIIYFPQNSQWRFYLYLKNIVKICIFGENAERFLNMCSFHDIKLLNIQIHEDKYYADIYAKDFFLLKDIIKKSNVKVKIVKKEGISFHIKKHAKRKIFFIASFLCLFLLWIGSHFLWGIRITGNHSVTDDLIQDFLQMQGIYYGMPLSKIPIFELRTNLRNAYDEITWVSIYLEGTNLHISLKENDTLEISKEIESASANLIADQTGIVDSIVVRQGTPMVTAGEEVLKGEVLISGIVEIPADDGTIKENRYCKADGDVYLIYDYPILENISLEYLAKEYTGNYIEKYDLYINNQRLKLPHLKIPYVKYDSITENIESPIINLLSLPLKIKKNTYQEYLVIKKKHTNSQAEKLLKEKLDKIILSLEEKGVQIIEKNVKISTNSAYLSMTGNLTVKSLCSEFKALEEIQ